jgi:signal transduction histidine kinase
MKKIKATIGKTIETTHLQKQLRESNQNLEILVKNLQSDLEETNRHLKEARAQLVQSEKMASLGQLVAGIAHEINTPIGAINSMHDTLFRTLDRLKEFIQQELPEDCRQIPKLEAAFKLIDDSNSVIKSGAERVINIVTRLKSFARLDEADLKTVDIHEGIEDTLVLIHHELKHNITIVKNYGDIPPISCFPSQLNQVFLNLLVNSKQAIKDKGIITITTCVKNKKVHIKFSDDGVGIPKESVSRIFDPGYTTKGIGVGTGLGLSISYNIIQNHRGEIKVTSELGNGTEFLIVLPMDLETQLEKEEIKN